MGRGLQWGIAISAVIIVGIVFFVVTVQAAALARDTRRLADVAEIRTALERYYFLYNRYPVTETPLALGRGDARVLCASAAGWQTAAAGCETALMASVPVDPAAASYQYTGNGETYQLDFYLEKGDTGVPEGWRRAGPEGIE